MAKDTNDPEIAPKAVLSNTVNVVFKARMADPISVMLIVPLFRVMPLPRTMSAVSAVLFSVKTNWESEFKVIAPVEMNRPIPPAPADRTESLVPEEFPSTNELTVASKLLAAVIIVP